MYLFRYALYFRAFPHLCGAVINQLCSHFSPLFHRFYNNSFSDDRSPGRQFPPDASRDFCLLSRTKVHFFGFEIRRQSLPVVSGRCVGRTRREGEDSSARRRTVQAKRVFGGAARISDGALSKRTTGIWRRPQAGSAAVTKQKERTAQRLPAPVLNAVSDQSCTYGIRDT